MGVDTKIAVPPQVALRDFVVVTNRLLGGDTEWWDLGNGAHAAVSNGLKAEPSMSMPECVTISGPTAWGKVWYLWHWEFGNMGYHGIMPRATPLSIALGRRLVDFFGGWVDYNDCDEHDRDYVRAARYTYTPSDGEEWEQHQIAMRAVEPLTDEEVLASVADAVYTDDPLEKRQ